MLHPIIANTLLALLVALMIYTLWNLPGPYSVTSLGFLYLP